MAGSAGPIFLHRGMRTGGTALVEALSGLRPLTVAYGVLHPSLERPIEELLASSSADWNSNHPGGFFYWRSIAFLLEGGMQELYVPRFSRLVSMQAEDDDPELLHYLAWVIDKIARTGKKAVVCFERSEGLLPWLRKNFPDGANVGLVREAEAVYGSWLEQALLGSWDFFDVAAASLKQDPEFFGLEGAASSWEPRRMDSHALRTLFTLFNDPTDAVRRFEMDISISLAGSQVDSSSLDSFGRLLGLEPQDVVRLKSRLKESGRHRSFAQRLERILDKTHEQREALSDSREYGSLLEEARDHYASLASAYLESKEFWEAQAKGSPGTSP